MTEEQARDELSALNRAPGSFLMLPTIENHYTTSLVYLYDEEGSPHCLYMLTDENGQAYGSAWEIEQEKVR